MSFKVIEFGANRERQCIYDFLLAINSNLGPISHRYWGTATYEGLPKSFRPRHIRQQYFYNLYISETYILYEL